MWRNITLLLRRYPTTEQTKVHIHTSFVLSSIYWIRRKFSTVYQKLKNSLSASVAPNVTANLLVDLDRGEIRNIKQDEQRLERTVFCVRSLSIFEL